MGNALIVFPSPVGPQTLHAGNNGKLVQVPCPILLEGLQRLAGIHDAGIDTEALL